MGSVDRSENVLAYLFVLVIIIVSFIGAYFLGSEYLRFVYLFMAGANIIFGFAETLFNLDIDMETGLSVAAISFFVIFGVALADISFYFLIL